MNNIINEYLLLDASHRVEVLVFSCLLVILVILVLVLSIKKFIKDKKDK